MNNNYEQLIALIEEQKVSILKNIVMDIVSEEENVVCVLGIPPLPLNNLSKSSFLFFI